MALGPLFKARETRLTNGMTVARLALFQQPVADQKLNTALADLDRRDHDDAPGVVLHGRWMSVHGPCNWLLL